MNSTIWLKINLRKTIDGTGIIKEELSENSS